MKVAMASSNRRGTLGLAREDSPHSGSSQFYVNLVDNPALDPLPSRWGYAVFGRVVEGMEVIDRIAHLKTETVAAFGSDVPVERPAITRAWVIDDAPPKPAETRVISWFASDLHLDPATPDIAARFPRFLAGPVRGAHSLYLLGDLFEAWLGDDDPEPAHRRVIAALAEVAGSGTLIYVMRGNRDFLIGEQFCADAGALLLADPAIITIGGTRALLSHGDGLCVDDVSYQRLRALVRDSAVQDGFMRLPLESRRKLATEARVGSRAHLAVAGEYITDVNQAAVEALMRAADVDLLIHGHTHRPDVHRFGLGATIGTRVVLGDWHATARVLQWDEAGWRLLPCPA